MSYLNIGISFPRLQSGQAHIWVADLTPSEDIASLKALLSADELKRYEGYSNECKKLDFLVSRNKLRQLLSHYMGGEPCSIVFDYNSNGKPFVAGSIRFNVSHSFGLSMFVFAKDVDVGIDIEYKRTNIDYKRIAKRFFAPGEYQEFSKLPSSEQIHGFYKWWVKKEAYAKARGVRLFDVLSKVEIPAITAPVSKIRSLVPEEKSFQISLIPIHANYEAAFASEETIQVEFISYM